MAFDPTFFGLDFANLFFSTSSADGDVLYLCFFIELTGIARSAVPGRSMIGSVAVGLQQSKVVFMDAFLLNWSEGLEIVVGSAKFVVAHGSSWLWFPISHRPFHPPQTQLRLSTVFPMNNASSPGTIIKSRSTATHKDA